MKDIPLVSVIIPVYNGEQYVESCLDNIMAQTYKNLDIIVVDDGSTDRSAAIARKYPVNLIRHEKNQGLSAARNTGIDAAKGEYIHFMDVDDGINTDYYKEMVKAITETGADIACGGMVNEKRRSKTQLFRKRKVYTSTQGKLKITYVGKWGYVWRYLFKRDFLKQYAFRFEEGRFIEDMIFSLSAMYHAKKLVVVPNTKYMYYNRENSIMNRRDEEHLKKRRQDWEHVKAFRNEFSAKYGIKLPGVHTGRIAYVIRKLVASIRYRE
ncbi:glycosyltransferase [uncultured Proteiniphilum sp.]|uniref:glycosyltransferase family 2 protein n=1 Tax=uncultured Proteiniphilum sp. TaxID=497637 RepID=UPI0026190291|nr:glycosyltransferase [uncultured Proteiniphilum sp.]